VFAEAVLALHARREYPALGLVTCTGCGIRLERECVIRGIARRIGIPDP
jgi:hypothetical protein